MLLTPCVRKKRTPAGGTHAALEAPLQVACVRWAEPRVPFIDHSPGHRLPQGAAARWPPGPTCRSWSRAGRLARPRRRAQGRPQRAGGDGHGGDMGGDESPRAATSLGARCAERGGLSCARKAACACAAAVCACGARARASGQRGGGSLGRSGAPTCRGFRREAGPAARPDLHASSESMIDKSAVLVRYARSAALVCVTNRDRTFCCCPDSLSRGRLCFPTSRTGPHEPP